MELTQSLHRNVQQSPDDVATVFGDRVRTWSESASPKHIGQSSRRWVTESSRS